MKARRVGTAAVLSIALAAAGAATASPAMACIPHLNSQGPTVYVTPDYQHPLQSDYDYDTEGTYAEVVTCLG